MADIRIKDLSSASSSASDDFIAIDGTTNGTRKLNAFSPTFGGNATVTGTLTTNGGVIIPAAGSISTLTSTNATHVANATWGALSQGYGTTADWSVFNKSQGTVMYVPTGTSNLFLYGKLDANTLSVYSTTASTTTSSGALVVSGGVGVAGAINAGNNIVSTIASAPNGSEFTGLQTKIGTDGTLGPCLVHVGALPSATAGSRYGYVTCYDTGDWRKLYLGGSPGVGPSGGQVLIPSTLSSTSTSSGALVVSGGVGVAGAINAGSGLVANPLFTQTRKLEAQIPHTVSTEDYLRIGSNTGSTNTYAGEFGYGLTAGGSPQIRFNRVHAGTVTTWLTVPTSTGDAEFAGSVKTAAPSGGTAAAWKLGTVATVSPTSPNRTIEVDIGGTIYYIHAKTTNN